MMDLQGCSGIVLGMAVLVNLSVSWLLWSRLKYCNSTKRFTFVVVIKMFQLFDGFT